jgi:conjugative transposon TraM protein
MLENFKAKVLDGIKSKPKYMLPLVSFVFFVILNGIAQVIIKPKENLNQKTAGNAMNAELQDPNLDKSQTKNKFDALFEAYDKKTDFSAIQDLQGMNTDIKSLELDDKNLYSMSEMERISNANGRGLMNDKNEANASNYAAFKNSGAGNPFAELNSNTKGASASSNYLNRGDNTGFNKSYSNYENHLSGLNNPNNPNNPNNLDRYNSSNYVRNDNYPNANNYNNARDAAPKRSAYDENMALFKAQMSVIDSMTNMRKGKQKGNSEMNEEAENGNNRDRKNDRNNKASERIIEVTKTEQDNSRYFNTVGLSKNNSFIKAILDEGLKVYDGSRVRIRLMDDIKLGDKTLERGTYLYGIISGFATQRVQLTITSVAHNSEILNVKLDVYDQDGMKGLYIPESLFREIAKEAGSKSIGQNIQFSESNTANASSIAYSAAQDIYRTSTRAMSDAIRKRKAVLKYNTQIFLVNVKN